MPFEEAQQDTRSVLYVEDEPLNVLMMRALFNYRPTLDLSIATRGEEALDVAAMLSPALLLLDLHLPDCHGADLLKQLRRLPNCKDVPAIAVTSDQTFDKRGTGFCEIWHKPFMLFHTLDRIDKRLLHRRGPSTPSQRSMLSAA